MLVNLKKTRKFNKKPKSQEAGLSKQSPETYTFIHFDITLSPF
jgi:hypothetical protein